MQAWLLQCILWGLLGLWSSSSGKVSFTDFPETEHRGTEVKQIEDVSMRDPFRIRTIPVCFFWILCITAMITWFLSVYKIQGGRFQKVTAIFGYIQSLHRPVACNGIK